MNDIRDILSKQLREGNLDLLDIVQIPSHSDPMVRLKTLEEALEDFNRSDDGRGAVGYLIQVRREPAAAVPSPAANGGPQARQPVAPPAPAANHAVGAADSSEIYLPQGKLNIPFLSRNAELLLAAGEYALAKNIYRAILGSGERSGLALFGIARCEEAEGRLEEARANYEESIAYHPTLDSYHRLASVLMAQGKDQLAAEAFERALNLKAIEPATRFELHKACGNCWARASSPEGQAGAERHFRQALEINPSADEIRSNLGAVYLAARKVPEARRNFEDALASNPRNAKALTGLASCHLAQGDKRQAHDLFARALDVDLNNPNAIYHLVKCAYEIKSYATAARVVEEYVQVAPVNVNLMYSLAGLQFHLGRADDARATCRQILELQAGHAGANELLKLIDRIAGS